MFGKTHVLGDAGTRRAGGSKGKIAPKIQEPLEKGGDAVGVEKWWIYMDLYTCGTSS
jgi:hypothetical protein